MSDSDKTQKKSKTRTIMLKTGIIASVILLAGILLLWYDDFVGLLILAYIFWITIPSLIVFLIAFVKSLKWKTRWHKAMFGCGLCVVLLFVAYLLFRAPEQHCNPDIMAKHYEKHKTEMEELCEYMHSALADSTAVILVFDGNKLDEFCVSAADSDHFSSFWNEDASSKRDSLMSVVGLTNEEYESIRNQLKTIGCIGIKTSQTHPEFTEIQFRQVGFAVYSYILYDHSMNDEEKEQALDDSTVIPYNDRTLFYFVGGAVGAEEFPSKMKKECIEKFKPW